MRKIALLLLLFISLPGYMQNKQQVDVYWDKINEYRRAAEKKPNDADIYRKWGSTLINLARLNDDSELYRNGVDILQKAADLDIGNYETFYAWGVGLYFFAQQNDSLELYKESLQKYQRASLLRPNNADFYSDWGVTQARLAGLTKDTVLYKRSIDKFLKAKEIRYDDPNIDFRWGVTLIDLAALTNDPELYKESIKKFQFVSTYLWPNKNPYVFYYWGIALRNLAQLTNDPKLYKKSVDKFMDFLRLSPDNPNWGSVLTQLRLTKTELFESIKNCRMAAEKQSDNPFIYNNWGLALICLAESTNAPQLYRESIVQFQKAAELIPENARFYYNIARSYSLLNEKDSTFEYLEKSFQYPPTRVYLENDFWLDALKDDPRFRELLDKYLPEK